MLSKVKVWITPTVTGSKKGNLLFGQLFRKSGKSAQWFSVFKGQGLNYTYGALLVPCTKKECISFCGIKIDKLRQIWSKRIDLKWHPSEHVVLFKTFGWDSHLPSKFLKMSSTYDFVVNARDMGVNVEGKNGWVEYIESASETNLRQLLLRAKGQKIILENYFYNSQLDLICPKRSKGFNQFF